MRRLITLMIEDVIAQSRRRLVELEPASSTRCAAPAADGRLLAAMAEADRAIKDFLYPRMYRHARIVRIMGEAEEVVRRPVRAITSHAERPAGRLAGRTGPVRCRGRARRIADFIAGMTDRYALAEHARLFGATPELR